MLCQQVPVVGSLAAVLRIGSGVRTSNELPGWPGWLLTRFVPGMLYSISLIAAFAAWGLLAALLGAPGRNQAAEMVSPRMLP